MHMLHLRSKQDSYVLNILCSAAFEFNQNSTTCGDKQVILKMSSKFQRMWVIFLLSDSFDA